MSSWTLSVRMSNGTRLSIEVSPSASVLETKQAIAERDSQLSVDRQRLIYKGKILDDAKRLDEYQITDKATLFVVKSSAPNTTNASNNAATNNNNNANRGSPFGGANPDQMQQMLNSPLLQNPDFLQRHMESNPQMQAIFEQHPELRHAMSDPAFIRQAMDMMRHPDHMNQVMRQQDLALSQLENMPGGFAALSNLYTNVQEPMFQAQQQPSSTTTRPNASTDATEGATGAAMPNPWSSNNNNNRQPSTARSTPSNAATPPPNPFGGNPNMANPWGANPWGTANPMMPGAAPNSQMMAQIMSQMWNSNPQGMQQMLEQSHPMLQQMRQSNPAMADFMIQQVRNIMNNPQQLQAMLEMSGGGGGMNPMMMMNMMNNNNNPMMNPPGNPMMNPPGNPMMNQSGNPMMNQSGNPTMNPPAMNNSNANPWMQPGMDFSNMLNQFQAMQMNNTTMPPEQRYARQLQSLRDMGFEHDAANMAALNAHGGNLNRAVDDLIMGRFDHLMVTASAAATTAPSPEATTAPSAEAAAAPSAEASAAPSVEAPSAEATTTTTAAAEQEKEDVPEKSAEQKKDD